MPRRAHVASADGSRVSATARLPDAGKIFMTRMNAASTRQMPLVAISGHCPTTAQIPRPLGCTCRWICPSFRALDDLPGLWREAAGRGNRCQHADNQGRSIECHGGQVLCLLRAVRLIGRHAREIHADHSWAASRGGFISVKPARRWQRLRTAARDLLARLGSSTTRPLRPSARWT